MYSCSLARGFILSDFLVTVKNTFLSISFSRSRAFVVKQRVVTFSNCYVSQVILSLVDGLHSRLFVCLKTMNSSSMDLHKHEMQIRCTDKL